VKFAWTRYLLKMRNDLPEVFTSGVYEPLEVSGPHRDHMIAFARRHGNDAVISVVAKSFAPFSQAGRIWPRPDVFDASIRLPGYSVQGLEQGTMLPVSALFENLPAAVLKARFEGVASEPARKRVRA
jgi:(1->4)-alpha-D-glucan 1-alpha-D-glucosylmutase